MASNKKITDLPASIPSGGFNFIAATGAPTNSNYRIPYVDIAEYSSIGTKTGQFTDKLTISGLTVLTSTDSSDLKNKIAIVSGNVNTVSGNLVATGVTLLSDINTVSSNLSTTGATLLSEIGTVSSNLSTTGAFLLSSLAEVSGSLDNVSGSLNDVSGKVDALSGNLISTGSLLLDSVTEVSGNVDTLSGNLIATGTSLLSSLTYVSGEVDGILTTGLATESGEFSKSLTADAGSFTSALTASGIPVTLGVGLEDGEVVYYSGSRFRGDKSRLSITDVGVGVNAPNPTYTLEVGGDMNIQGTLYTGGSVIDVTSEQLNTSGALIYLNSGEVGAGVTTDLAGLLVDRGTLPSGYMLFTESYKGWSPSHNLVVTGGINLGIGTTSPTSALHMTSGKLTALTGEFSDTLTVSGDLRVSGDAYFTPETIYVGQAPLSSDGQNLSGHGLVLSNYEQIRPDYNQGTGSFSNPVYNSITQSGYLRVKRVDTSELELSAFASSEIFGDLAGSNILLYWGKMDGTRIIEGLDLWQNQRAFGPGHYCALANTWVKRLSIPDITQEYFVGVKFENGAFEGYPFGVARTNVAVKDMVEEKPEQPHLGNFFSQSSLKLSPTIPGLQNVQFSGVSGNFSESLTVSGVSVATGAGGGGIPGGSDTNIQFNDGGSFGGTSSLIYNNTANYLSGASGIFDSITGSACHWGEEVTIGTGADVALIANDAGNVGIGWSGTPTEPIAAQLHVSGSTIISGSSEITLDYDRLPKSNPNIKGRVWIEAVSGFLMISSGIASDPPSPPIISYQFVNRLAAGLEHSLFLTISGDVYAAGANTYGQLGDGTTVNKDEPTYITGDVTGVSAGAFHSIFLSTGSGVYTCGRNQVGQLGDGTTVNKDVPTYITGDVTGMSAGTYHSVLLSASGGVYTCGNNPNGQLGDGTTVNKDVPTYVTGDVTGVSAMGDHSMFLSTSSGAYACGLNTYGQLGDGATVNKDVPTYITGDVSVISAGGIHSMFISTGFDYYACGSAGAIGIGSTYPSPKVPTYISGDVSGIAGGYRHVIFLSTGSDVYTCGTNNLGQLGDGTTVNKLVPTYITGAVMGAAGYHHSIFLSNAGGLYTCGYNSAGQLGDGTTVNKDVPTYISGLGA